MYPEKKSIDDKAMFDDIVNAILSVMGDDAVKIILYGSVARGDNTWESDVDIAVLSSREYDWQEEKQLILSELSLEYDTLFSIKVIEEKHFYDWVDDLPFYHNIDLEGITLWTRENGRICLDTALKEQQKNLIFRDIY